MEDEDETAWGAHLQTAARALYRALHKFAKPVQAVNLNLFSVSWVQT